MKIKYNEIIMKIHEIKLKRVEYIKNKLYTINNNDKDILDENSELLIGSITKVFSVILLLLLHQKKVININSTFKKYLDNKQLINVKIIDVINHKAGIHNMSKNVKFDRDNEKNNKIYYNSTDFYNDLKKEKLVTLKKGIYSYSNLGYQILGALIESVTNMTYEEALTKFLLKPLRMNHTGFGKTKIILYTYLNKKLTKNQNNERFFAGSAGGLKSSISDLIKFSKFTKLLNKQTLKLLPKIIFEEQWHASAHEIMHTGSIPGGTASIKINYDSNWKVKDIHFRLSTIQGHGGYTSKEGYYEDWNKFAEQEKYRESLHKSKKK